MPSRREPRRRHTKADVIDRASRDFLIKRYSAKLQQGSRLTKDDEIRSNSLNEIGLLRFHRIGFSLSIRSKVDTS